MAPVSIGEFARLSRLSPQALRLYGELGLLPAARVDPDSRYRWSELGDWERNSSACSGTGRCPVWRVPGAAFLIYYGEVSEDSDGPIEWCRPVPDDQAQGIATGFPELTLRTEPAHSG